MTKYDRHGYKERRRLLALTNSSIILYDEKDMKTKLRLSLNDLPGITITNMGDGLLIIRIPAEQKKLKVSRYWRKSDNGNEIYFSYLFIVD